MAEEVVQTGCTVDCGGRCPLWVHVKDGVAVKIRGDEGEEPQLRACLRGRATRQRVYAPDRLRYPMKRMGERGAGAFQRISWDEALNTVARELKRVKETYGPRSILYWGSGSNAVLHGRRMGYRLLNMFGGCTTHWGSVSNGAGIFGSMSVYGTISTGNTRDDLVNSRLIILWGWNPAETVWDTNTTYHLAKAKEAGARFVAVDPRFTDTAAVYAERWVPMRPGGDTAALIAMAYVVIQEGLLDRNFLDTHTVGFDKYRDYVLGVEDGVPKTPAWAEPIAGVPAATLAALAREYATTRPAALIAGWGPGRAAYGEQFHRAATALACLTGNIGIHGGNVAGYERSYPSRDMSGIPVGRNPAEQGFPPRPNALALPGGMNPNSARIHISLFWDAILKGKAGGYPADFKLLYLLGGNPLNQHPNTNQGVQALKKLEFIVVHEQFMTASARFADILLPASTFLERNDIAAPWLSAPYYIYVHQAIEPLYEAKSDFQICSELAPRLGIEHFSDQTEEEWLRELAKGSHDIRDFEEFKEKGVLKVKLEEPYVAFKPQVENPERHRFPTPSGKVELFSQLLADMKDPEMPPVPKYLENKESPWSPLARQYPLQLITPHFRRQVHAGYANCPWLAEVEPFRLWINSADAQKRGIGDGDRVRVFNDRGTTVLQARVTERIMPGVVSLPEGGNYRPDDKGVDWGGCANVLTPEAPTPGGGAAVNTSLVQVEKL